jgi:RNase H-fold protein (predicted Holliday junction resolvase)
MGIRGKKRRQAHHSHLDELAAVVILQDYLEAHPA